MKIDDDIEHEAHERAERLLAHRTVEDQWNALDDAIRKHVAGFREQAVADMTLEYVANTLCPGMTREQWRKAGWSDVLSGRLAPDKFIHKLRLAQAAGSDTGKL